MNFWQKLQRDEEGATTIEYCVVLFFIITACIAGITAVGGSSEGLWGKNSTQLKSYM